MLARSASKVRDSAKAVELLHSQYALREDGESTGRFLRGNPL
jgi:hypothetical protein